MMFIIFILLKCQEIKNRKQEIKSKRNEYGSPGESVGETWKKNKGRSCAQELWRRAPSSESCEQISAVITNKFSTRNEVRKRERVNPKVRPKGVWSYFWYLADGKPGGANKAPERNGCCKDRTESEGGRATERKRGIAPFSIEKSDGWKQLKIRDVFSIPRRDIRNYCLCFSSSTAVFIPLKLDPPPTVPMSYLSNSSSQPQPASFFWSLNPDEDTPIHDLSLVSGPARKK